MNNSKETLFDFRTALSDLHTFHGIQVNEDDFYEIGMLAWKKIGNRRVKYYILEKQELDSNKRIELPCNVYSIEGVTVDKEWCDINNTRFLPLSTITIPSVVKTLDLPSHNLDFPGTFVNYELLKLNGAEYIEVAMNEGTPINVIYTGLYVDEDGFPMLTQKESEAIAWYILYLTLHKQKLAKQSIDPNDMIMAKREWTRACGDARVPELLNQNVMDNVLNVMNSHNRKQYGRPFKLQI